MLEASFVAAFLEVSTSRERKGALWSKAV